MAKSKVRKGVKEKQAAKAKVIADAKKLQNYRMEKYIGAIIQEQLELEKNESDKSTSDIEDAVIIEDTTDETSI